MALTHHRLTANGIGQHCVTAGSGPAVVLLHGFPEFWYEWRHQIPALARRHTVIAPDLRGYGYTDKPDDGYDKATMANDVRQLCRALGHERAAVVGRDRGARVALRLARDHPGFVDRLVLLGDGLGTDVSAERMTATPDQAQRRFVFAGAPGATGWTLSDIAEYVRAYRQPGAALGACHDHRADGPPPGGGPGSARDGAGPSPSCPVLALRTADAPDPDALTDRLLRFLAPGGGGLRDAAPWGGPLRDAAPGSGPLRDAAPGSGALRDTA